MKMLVNQEWLRKKIKTEPDVDTDAGMSVESLQSISMFLPQNLATNVEPGDDQRLLRIKHAFGLMIHQLRLRDGLTIETLAAKAKVMTKELEEIEYDPHFQARPRTVVKLAKVFEVNVPKMMELSGVAVAKDESLGNEALIFAAKSNGVSSLNSDEQHLLNNFVKLLNDA